MVERLELLSNRYHLLEGQIYLSGMHALVRLPIDVRRLDNRAGLNTAAYISGYEGSPLAGYDLELGNQRKLLDSLNVIFQPGVNEELAATAIQGTQLVPSYEDSRFAGITGYWYGKAPGLDRATDAMRHNNLAGTHHLGGALAIVGNDPAAKSSSLPSYSEQLFADLGMPIFYPSDPQDVLDLGIHAVAMSRASGLWIGFKIVTNVADGSGTAEVSPDRITPVIPELHFNNHAYVHQVDTRLLQPNLTVLEMSRDGIRLDIARAYGASNQLNRIIGSNQSDRIGIVAAGRSFYDLMQALRNLGLDERELAHRGIRLLHLRMIYPLDEQLIRNFAHGLQEIIVVEEKKSFIEAAIRNELYGTSNPPIISGKKDPHGVSLFSSVGELDTDLIADALARRLAEFEHIPSITGWQEKRRPKPGKILLPLASRTPYYCSGCPHNTSRQIPEGSLVGGGIGCHTISLLMDPTQVGKMMGITQMGGEGAQWIGMAPFLGRSHLLQNIGDGTFHHSGSLAVRAAVAANVNITYKLLHNSAVALTGGQEIVGEMSLANIARTLIAEGVKAIIVTSETPKQLGKTDFPPGVKIWDRDRVIEAQEELAKISGVTVLIHDQECATSLRRKRKRGLVERPKKRIVINERICEGCGDCGTKSNCLSVQPVETQFGTKTRIDQSSCNLDFTCIKGDCPSFLQVIPGKITTRKGVAIDPEVELPLPELIVPADHFVMRILGVGGTGVVTLAQTLGVAASLAGKKVRSLDQTGLAQKGGAVISDLKFFDEDVLFSNRSVMGECDLYLAADILASAEPQNLVVANSSKTVAVISTSAIATGHMVTNRSMKFPDTNELIAPILQATRASEAFTIDSHEVSSTLFGHDQFANIMLAGVAFQRGALPLPLRAITDAITLNGVAVELNLKAFYAGRLAVADPQALAQIMQTQLIALPVENLSLETLIAERSKELTQYQNDKYAAEYEGFIAQAHLAEKRNFPQSSIFTRQVAENLFKLMAYKDEYEVARLALDPATKLSIQAQFGEDAKISYLLHPPSLRALGVKNKITLGPWFKVFFILLKKVRFLRGSRVDPFGQAKVRKVERALIVEYRAVISDVCATLAVDNYEQAIKIAGLPELIRGYESIKLESVDRYQTQLQEGLQEFTQITTRN